jgi:hypothetical protein
MTGDRLEHVIGDAHFRELGDDRVPEVLESKSGQACGIS